MYELPELGYEFDALEPHIDARTMEIHHSKHHATYVAKLNDALSPHDTLKNLPIEELLTRLFEVPGASRTAVRNNGGGHYNHSLFWKMISPGGSKDPSGELAGAIKSIFGSTDNLKAKIIEAGVGRFGSGWAWLVLTPENKLEVMSTANQDSPLMEGNRELLGVDVWEHAYYLKYQNLRADYLEAWWHLVNWNEVEKRFSL